MKRDLDLIREIMLTLEDKMEYGQKFESQSLLEIIKDRNLSVNKLGYHIELLADSDFIKVKKMNPYEVSTEYLISTITSQGQDFIDTIRKDTTWKTIKEKAASVGGFTLGLLLDIGKDYLQKQLLGSSDVN